MLFPNTEHPWATKPLGELFRLSTIGLNPKDHPREHFHHYSIPAWDEFGGPALEQGKDIESGKFLLTERCILVSKLNPEISRVRQFDAPQDGRRACASTEIMAFVPRSEEADLPFFAQYMSSERFRQKLVSAATGTTNSHKRVRPPETLKWRVPVPPLDEQAAIARILDSVDKVIELTREAVEQTITIRRALMQKLLPPWIGFRHLDDAQIPAGVQTIEVARDVADICNGSTPSRVEGRYWRDGTIPWLATGKVHDRVITQANEYVTTAALRECSISLLPRGTVLVGMIGQGRTRGMSAYLDIEACINQNFGAFVPRKKVFGKWLFYYFDYHYSRLREIGGGTNQGALSCFLLKRIRLPLPEQDRQEEVAAILDTVERLEQARKLILQQYIRLKRALLHDLLTGKMRVNSLNLAAVAGP